MKCEQCSQPATVHLTNIERGTASSRHLCLEHARRYAQAEGIPDQALAGLVPVTIEVTQAQVDNEEFVDVALPGGGSERLRVPRNLTPDMTWVVRRPASARCMRCVFAWPRSPAGDTGCPISPRRGGVSASARPSDSDRKLHRRRTTTDGHKTDASP